MQFGQGGNGDARRSRLHTGALDGVDHPSGQDDDDAETYFDMKNVAAGAPFDDLQPQSATVQRMPAVMDFDVLPDMGRMTARWPWDGRHGSLPAPTAAPSAPPPWRR